MQTASGKSGNSRGCHRQRLLGETRLRRRRRRQLQQLAAVAAATVAVANEIYLVEHQEMLIMKHLNEFNCVNPRRAGVEQSMRG